MMSHVQNKQITMSFWVSLVLPSSPPGPPFYALFYAHKQCRLQEVYKRLDGTLSPAHGTVSDFIVRKKVIVHVEGVDVISVRRVFIFFIWVAATTLHRMSHVCVLDTLGSEASLASQLSVFLCIMRELWCKFTYGFWLPRSFLLIWNDFCHCW